MINTLNRLRRWLADFISTVEYSIVIEEATTNDLAGLSDIHRAAFSVGWSDGDLGKMLATRGYACLVARQRGFGSNPPFGFVLTRCVLDEAEVITIAVTPERRRNGIAQKLMDEAIRRLQRDRVKLLFLEVEAGNKAAKQLYSRLGFEHVSKRKNYYVSHGETDRDATNALVMKRNLG